jgi:hypothetical protein
VAFVKQTILWLILAGVIILAYVVYQSQRSNNDLNVEPHAAEEIEKAKRQ